MAFVPNNFSKVDGYASDADAVVNVWMYNSLSDTEATVEAADYFLSIYERLSVNDLMFLIMEDGSATGLYLVSAASSTTVTITGFATIGAGGVDTTQLADDAVTTAKLNEDTIQYVAVNLSAANIIAMYATPVVLLAAGGADTLHRVVHAELVVDYGAAQFTGGGALAIQYDTTANGAGVLASAALAAATLNGYSADSTVGLAGASASGAASAKVNTGLYMSNLTGAFATGDSVVTVHLWYQTVVAGL